MLSIELVGKIMNIISVKLNYSTERKKYRVLGNLLIAQALLNSYLSEGKGVEPEGYAEEFMEKHGIDKVLRDEVLNMFACALLAIAQSNGR